MMKNKINFVKALKKEEILIGVVKLVENGASGDGKSGFFTVPSGSG